MSVEVEAQVHPHNRKQPKERVVVVAPGRGSYNKDELGYLSRHHQDKADFIQAIDAYRRHHQQVKVSELDGKSKYSFKLHTPGENASALIYACAMADFMEIDQDKYDVVAITGNSMGWYIALACSGALGESAAIEVIDTMGAMMSDGLIGGQLIYPQMDEQWRIDPIKCQWLDNLIAEVNSTHGCELYTSIELGGYRVIAGNEAGLKLVETQLPEIEERYPMRLYNHGAFHTPLLEGIASRAQGELPQSLFNSPNVPLVDGRGQIWTSLSCDVHKLWQYTLNHQVTQSYDFTLALQVAVKEFAPDKLIILGPGNTLGGPVAQSLIDINWFNWQSKSDFISSQEVKQDGGSPKLLAMGNDEQRINVVKVCR